MSYRWSVECQTCVDCGSKSPETDTNYTLISAQHGWRLHRGRTPDGQLVMEWRCPTCWRKFKDANGMPDSSRTAGGRDSARSFFARASRRLRGQDSEPPQR